MTVSRAFANVLTDDVAGTRDFYVNLLGFTVAFDSDWFVNLTSGTLDLDDGHGTPAGELGIWRRDHELLPDGFRQQPGGVVLSFVVDDVDAVHVRAQQQGLAIVAGPQDLFYGQRRLLLTDPNGALVDVSTPTAMSEAFTASLVQDGNTIRQKPEHP
ncbi:VOC family protein [Sciscionella marina]|uniref:VOC family protein n=1 Tax=Sciscionella marina TaxID=508770 RepID=UPI0007C538EE|nr:VOC family protein [Sciscionella marina]